MAWRLGNDQGFRLYTGMTATASSASSTLGDGGPCVVRRIESNTLCPEHE
jgi:hypothetical protein